MWNDIMAVQTKDALHNWLPGIMVMQRGIVGKKRSGESKSILSGVCPREKRIEEDVISFVMNMNVKP